MCIIWWVREKLGGHSRLVSFMVRWQKRIVKFFRGDDVECLYYVLDKCGNPKKGVCRTESVYGLNLTTNPLEGIELQELSPDSGISELKEGEASSTEYDTWNSHVMSGNKPLSKDLSEDSAIKSDMTTQSSTYPFSTELDISNAGISDGESGRISSNRSRSSRREDPRRHTLDTNNLYVHAQHPNQISLEIDPQLPQEYALSHNAYLFEDDPGVMSEVETASTGFRRGGKQRSSLPVVRTPSKTLERPLGLVFLQYRNETKRALLPNEITSLDTVKALFVRSFSKQLTMQYMESPAVKVYIHDSSKDMFYELEDVRYHLSDIRDRSVLRLFESSDVVGGSFPGTAGVGPMPSTSSSGNNPAWEESN